MILNKGINQMRWIVMLAVFFVFAGSLWMSMPAKAQGTRWRPFGHADHSVSANVNETSRRTASVSSDRHVNGPMLDSSDPNTANGNGARALMSDLNLSTGDKVHWADGSYISGGETLNMMTFSTYTGFSFYSYQAGKTVLSSDNTQLYFNLPFNIGRGYINSTDGSFGNPSTNLFQANMYGGNFTFYDTQHSANSMTIAAGSGSYHAGAGSCLCIWSI